MLISRLFALAMAGYLQATHAFVDNFHMHATAAPGIHHDRASDTFFLQSKSSTYAFRIEPSTKLPQHLYWGPLISSLDDLSFLAADSEVISFDAGPKNSMLLEYADGGTGDFRIPAFRVRYGDDGSVVSPLTYVSHEITTGSEPLPPSTPHFRTSGQGADTLTLRLQDALKGLVVSLRFTVFHDFDSITRSVSFKNEGSTKVTIEAASSFMVDFAPHQQSEPFYLTQLSGSWARERHPVSKRLDVGTTLIESRRGASSHQHNPAFIVSEGPAHELHGNHYAFALVYPSSFEMKVEITQSATMRVLGGVHPDSFRWVLDTGENFETPEALLTFGVGLQSLTHNLHAIVRSALLPGDAQTRWGPSVPRPILVNSWEAMYFNCSESAFLEKLVYPAKEVGIELVVLDDGWFGYRFDDARSLGDWYVNTQKFPGGLGGLSARVRAEGLMFGIWMEPEMISKNSNLYREHPDWCLHVNGRDRTEGRNQLVLDLSRDDVQRFIISVVTKTLQDSQATYLKWDFNRHLTEVGSSLLSAEHQGEVLHRWVMGLYKVLHTLTSAFPQVLFEQCSGGGGRYDLAMMYFSTQIWTSDNTDAIARAPIQTGSLLFYPGNVMASHVSAVPNHQLHRSTSLTTRHTMSMAGMLGYELDLQSLSWQEKQLISKFIGFYKRDIEPLVLTGLYYRLTPLVQGDRGDFDSPTSVAWMYVDKNKKSAIVYTVLTSYYDLVVRPCRLQLKGLDPGALYHVEMMRQVDNNELQTVLSLRAHGNTLMSAGLVIKWWRDADSLLVTLKQVLQ